jgi:hypothetical protein
LFIVGIFAVSGFAVYFLEKYYKRTGIEPAKNYKVVFWESPAIPLWLKILHIAWITVFLLGIGVLVRAFLRVPVESGGHRVWAWGRLPWILLLSGCLLVGLVIYFSNKYYEHGGITPTKKQKMEFMHSPMIPLWVKILHIAGTILVGLGIGGLVLAFFNVPILPGVHRVWDRGILPWILLLIGLVIMVVLKCIPKKYRQIVQWHTGADDIPQWVIVLVLMSLGAMGIGIWMIASAFFD